MKLHLICATNRLPLCYELTAANVAQVRLTKELLEATNLGGNLARAQASAGFFGDLAYRSEALEEVLAESGIFIVSNRTLAPARKEAAGGE